MSSSTVGSHAVVIGAGMGGLAAAAAVADHSIGSRSWSGLPSDGTVPSLGEASVEASACAPGRRASRTLRAVSGFEDDLLAAGAVPLRGGIDIRTERPGFDPFPARDLSIRVYAMSRPLLEFTVRERLGKARNVEVRSQVRVTEIVASPDGSRATGVRFVEEDGTAGFSTSDLVIDASGRGVPTIALLEATGRRLPEETQIGVNVGYTTARYRIPTNRHDRGRRCFTFPRHRPRAGAAFCTRWKTTSGSWRSGDEAMKRRRATKRDS